MCILVFKRLNTASEVQYLKEIITALMIWLGANTTFDTNHDTPMVVFLPQSELNQMYYNEPKVKNSDLHGLYDKDSDIIYLPDDWDRRKPWDLGVLLHEIMHYLQDMERDVWPTQRDYLKKVHNYEWDYDELWYKMISTCNPF